MERTEFYYQAAGMISTAMKPNCSHALPIYLEIVSLWGRLENCDEIFSLESTTVDHGFQDKSEWCFVQPSVARSIN